MVISSIDLKDGHVVQLKNGKDLVLQRDDADSLISDFNFYGEVAVIDLDAAMGHVDAKGNTVNTNLLKSLLRKGNVRTGGGVRSVKRARELISLGAEKVIIGSSAWKKDPKPGDLVFYEMGQYTNVIFYYQKSLDILMQNLGEGHPNIGILYCSIGDVYNKMEEHAKALDCFLKALDIFKKSGGETSMGVAGCYVNIGAEYLALGDKKESIKALQKALKIFKLEAEQNADTIELLTETIKKIKTL